MPVTVHINTDDVLKRLHGLGDIAVKVEKYTISDMRTRAKPPVATAVAQVYNLTKARVGATAKVVGHKNTARSGFKGGLDSIEITFTGRRLAGWPLKAKPAPKKVRGKAYSAKRKYDVTQSVFRGKWSGVSPEAGRRIFIIKSGSTKIPMEGGAKREIRVHASLSVPQAVMNEKVVSIWQPELTRRINERMLKHYRHFVK